MMAMAREGVAGVLLAGVVVSLAYCVVAIVRVLCFRLKGQPSGAFTPPVTILKPVRGFEPALFDCLRSFCEQDYPEYQVVFGVRDEEDPAVPVIERLIRELPHRDLSLVVDGRTYGANYKMSNLTNMMPRAKHGILVVADADSLVGPAYLRSVVASFEDRNVGAATCLYVGRPMDNLASALGASFMNDWFLPSVLIGLMLEKLGYCFGATMAVRREALEAIGGFKGLAPYLADDYLLGRLVRERGLEVRLASFLVTTAVFEPDFATLLRHELRWGRTLRTVRPIGWFSTLLTDTTVLALSYLLASGGKALAVWLVAAALLLRWGVQAAVRRRFSVSGPARLWLLPLRDLLCFAVRVASFAGRRVEWKGDRFVVQSTGHLVETKGDVPKP